MPFVLCSGVDEALFEKYEEVASFQSQTILNTSLNIHVWKSNFNLERFSWAIN
jgi:hypothetical protein